jgi:hypothetical protein
MSPERSTPRVVPIGMLAVQMMLPPGRTKLGEQEKVVVFDVFILTKIFGLLMA